MDDVDAAQAREQNDRDVALLAMRERIDAALVPRDASIDGVCIDCDEPIEPKRIKALPNCSRCIECAKRHEHRLRGYRA